MRILLDRFTKTFGDLTVIDKMDLEIGDGEMLALLGPPGCGKSTTLFAICGIYKIDGGRILFGECDVTQVPSQQRNVGVVFQNYALYPHMTVAENIAFPLKIRKESASEIRRKVDEIAELVQIGPLKARRPAELSGGQQQRVALARALVRRPDVLLLDEPLANLDAKLRLEMRSEIRRIQRETGITAVLVTHDQIEAMSMSDRIAIMDNGRIVQIDEPMEMYRNPVSDFVAGFLGNPPIAFLDGRIEDGHFVAPEAEVRIPVSAAVSGRVSFIETQGRETLYDVTLRSGAVLRSVQTAQPVVKLGDTVHWGVDPAHVLLFDRDGARF
jgi:inositol-phosphate transport system ATP-binding protein